MMRVAMFETTLTATEAINIARWLIQWPGTVGFQVFFTGLQAKIRANVDDT